MVDMKGLMNRHVRRVILRDEMFSLDEWLRIFAVNCGTTKLLHGLNSARVKKRDYS